ncbi:hypothetical protein NON27_27375, partial [Vibrio parahaemolyticus]|nr:hypothetical protein [Vibrio parahaemolyticus]
EEEFRIILNNMADFLLTGRNTSNQLLCDKLLAFLRESQSDARKYQENYWVKQTQYYDTYFSMRRTQINVIKDMQGNLDRIQDPVPYGKHIYGL